MISRKMEQGLNDQIKHELSSAYIYMSMAAWFQAQGWKGFAGWMDVQAKEEQSHAQKFMGYLYDVGGRVTLQPIDKPQGEFSSPLNVFEETLKHEQFITGKINELMRLAVQENDFATQVMLHWFVNEQVEEEANASELVHLAKMAGDKPQALLMLDHQLGKRKSD